MNKLRESNKGSAIIIVVVISALVLLMVVPMMSIAMNTYTQTRTNTTRLEHLTDTDDALVILRSLLQQDSSYLQHNTSGTLNRSTYKTSNTVYTEETTLVYNSGTGNYDTVVIGKNYVYTVVINNFNYKIHAHLNIPTNVKTVSFVKQ